LNGSSSTIRIFDRLSIMAFSYLAWLAEQQAS
jgi:hypothetical protein